nr:GAF domain-containing protein [Pseudodesulfovibrio sp. S3-i]
MSKQSLIVELESLRRRVRELEDTPLRNLLEQTSLIGIALDSQARITSANANFLKLTGWSETDILGRDWFDMFIPAERRGQAREAFKQIMDNAEIGEYARFDNEIIAHNGEHKRISWFNMLTINTDGVIQNTTCLGEDLTEERRAESVKLARLKLLESSTSKPHSELLAETIDIAEELTNSKIGFLHFLESDQKTISLQAWSSKMTSGSCLRKGSGKNYDLDMAEVWTGCIQTRTPVVHNAPPLMKGKKILPEGHPAIQRLLVVPVIRGGKVMAVLGVGNKPVDYNATDIKTTSLLADLTWEIIEGRRQEENSNRMSQLLTQAQNLAQVGGWELNLISNTFYWTESMYRIFGYASDEIQNNHQFFMENIVHPDDRELIDTAFESIFTQKQTVSVTFRIIRKDGKVRTMEGQATPELDTKGKIIRIYGANLDITRRNEIETELQQNLALNMSLARLYRPIVSSGTSLTSASNAFLKEAQRITGSGDGFVSAVNDDGVLVVQAHTKTMDMNTMTDKDKDIITALNPSDKSSNPWGHGVNTQRPHIYDNKSAQPSEPEEVDERASIRNMLAVPVLLGNDLVGQIVLANKPDDYSRRDMQMVTRLASYYSLAIQRLISKKALTSQRDLMQSILTGIRAAIVQIDPQTQIIETINDVALEMLGGPEEDYVGKICDVFCWKARDANGFLDCPVKKRPVTDKEMPIKCHDGTNLPVLKTVLRETINGQEKFLEVFFDISERKELERQLALAQKLESIGQLSAGIAHEINTPVQYLTDNLNFLSTSFETLKDMVNRLHGCICKAEKDGTELVIDEEWQRLDMDFILKEIPMALNQSRDGIDRVTTIVRAMKRFSHPGMDSMQLADINEALQTTVTISKNEWKYHTSVAYHLAEDIPLVPCLLNDLNQVFLNIIMNASQAIAEVFEETKEHGTIDIRTWHDDHWVCIEISDTGTGIPESVLPRVFDPFFTTKEVGLGTGQGLALCYSIVVDKHHGTIDFTSEVGVGTTCTIRLPLLGAGTTNVQ